MTNNDSNNDDIINNNNEDQSNHHDDSSSRKKIKNKKKEKKVKKRKDKEDKKEKKKSKKSKKRERSHDDVVVDDDGNHVESQNVGSKKRKYNNKEIESHIQEVSKKKISFPIKYVLAPMVGASELAFRLLCRKYGAQASYTPMMNSHMFANDPKYREEEFQTIAEDRPLVCHFSANDPKDFTAAAKLVEDKCDAVDLNLGCPQRTAYVGHFGSYLLDKKDRNLICSIVREASKAISIPVFVKIRLLDTIEETIELCQQLRNAGASLIAIHARYRASFERKGPGARDGPALLENVLRVREALGDDFPIISNGNVITFDDVENNMVFTRADGIMSAEGILDSPALYLPQYGDRDNDGDKEIQIAVPSSLKNTQGFLLQTNDLEYKKKRKLTKKLREIQKLETKLKAQQSLSKEEEDKISLKESIEQEISEIEDREMKARMETDGKVKVVSNQSRNKTVLLRHLYEMSDDKLSLASEYLNLVLSYPTKLRTVIFHIRRMLKQYLNTYQLMEECINAKSVDDVAAIIKKIEKYRKDPSTFHFDKEKDKKEKEALERKKREEGKRKAYEARMVRKAKREGRDDLEFYLRQGAKVPTIDEVQKLRFLSKEDQLQKWKDGDHSQHCLAYHLFEGGCKRDRSCAFLHADAQGEHSFQEVDEVAG